MKKQLRRLLSLVVAAALTAGMTLTASAAFTYPSAYWKLHDAWAAAVSAKNADQVLTLAKQTYDLLTPYGMNENVCGNLEVKCAQAAWCSEQKGDIAGAITWLQRQRSMAAWLDANVHSYKDTLLNIDAKLEYLNAAKEMAIYVQTEQSGNHYASSGAKDSGTLLGSAVTGSQRGESASLMYVPFGDSHSVAYWLDYYRSQSSDFDRAASDGGVIELAWNFSPESTAGAQAVLSADSYIDESVAAMGAVNATVLLRVGAEMDNWSDCDPAIYIQAFQKIADAAHRYSNIKLVFSPTEISNRNHTFADFYPGDQYVDWIGVSSYHNTNYVTTAGGSASYATFDPYAYSNDPYYNSGLYAGDPLILLRPLTRFAQSHGKPMMISECGFSYRSGSGGDQTAYAADQLNKFYSYVNMIYPQVKAVFYFDNNISGSPYQYALSGSSTMAAAYSSAIANNGGYLKADDASAKTWKGLSSSAALQGTSAKLATYVSFPGQAAATVNYYLDGKWVANSGKAPYYYTLDLTSIAPGTHTVQAKAASGQFSGATQTYTFTVLGDGSLPLYSASDWAKTILKTADDKGLITDRNKVDFQSKITRLQFADLAVNLIERATGTTITPAADGFSDTNDVAARKAVAAGVTSGMGNGKFQPDAPIDRQQICVMLNKVIQYVAQTTGTDPLADHSTEMGSHFTDTASIADWARDSVALLTNNGLMSGKDGGRVAPKDQTKVEEAVALILALSSKF